MTSLMFGVGVPTVTTGPDPVELARLAEDLGLDFVSASDHPCGSQPTYETWTLLAWLAAATSRIRVASRVLGVPYRSPAMVAKMAETLDRLSAGRLILGLGGGSSDEEFAAFGLAVPTPREKVEGLEEAVQIVRGLWSAPGFSFAGRHHRVVEADLEPKPSHRIPVWLGTFGDRALAVTGALADGWIPSLGHVPDDEFPAMHAKVMAAAQAAGRRREDITCALNLELGTAASGAAGSLSHVVELVERFAQLGFTAFNFRLGGERPAEEIRQVAREVIPAVAGASRG